MQRCLESLLVRFPGSRFGVPAVGKLLSANSLLYNFADIADVERFKWFP